MGPVGERYYTERTRSYLKWRYAEIPDVKYGAVRKFKQTECAAVIFRERTRHKLRELSLSELLLSPGPSGVDLAKELIQEIAENTKADYMVATAAAHSLELQALRASGFLPFSVRGPLLTARIVCSSCVVHNPFDWNNWHCSLGDLEIF
jgi:hypothetical protein